MDKNTVVAGIDGSKESFEAAKWAATRALKSGLKLCLLSAYSLPSYGGTPMDVGYPAVDDQIIRENSIAELERVKVALSDYALEIETIVEPGDPTAVLVEASKTAGLVVIGTRGQGGFADRLLGSTSASLPAHGHCPVVVVPRNVRNLNFLPVTRIVVGVDGSHGAAASLHAAFSEAKIWEAELTAVEAVPMGGTAGFLAWLPAAVDREAILMEVREELRKTCGELSEEYQYPVHSHVMDGTPTAVLTEFSTAVELVVVGAKGKGGFAGMIMGSTSQSVLAYSYCPILVIPNHE